MVAGVLDALRRRINARTLRRAAFYAALAFSVWGAYCYVDWFLFFAQRNHVVRDLDAYASALRQTGLPLEAAGTLQYGGARLPLWVVHKPALQPNSKTVCLMGSIHGNEPAGAQTLLELSQDMARHPAVYARLNYVVLPMANPWGWARDLRRNADNDDIARQFVDGTSQESELAKNVLTQAHCDLLVDLHEDRSHEGFYLLAYAPPDTAAVQAAVATIASKSAMAHASKPARGVWSVPASAFAGIHLTTASLWAREHGVPLAFIVEVHNGHDLAQRVRVHATAVEELTRLLTTAP